MYGIIFIIIGAFLAFLDGDDSGIVAILKVIGFGLLVFGTALILAYMPWSIIFRIIGCSILLVIIIWLFLIMKRQFQKLSSKRKIIYLGVVTILVTTCFITRFYYLKQEKGKTNNLIHNVTIQVETIAKRRGLKDTEIIVSGDKSHISISIYSSNFENRSYKQMLILEEDILEFSPVSSSVYYYCNGEQYEVNSYTKRIKKGYSTIYDDYENSKSYLDDLNSKKFEEILRNENAYFHRKEFFE